MRIFLALLLLFPMFAVAKLPSTIYSGFGWRFFQLGTTDNGSTPVNGDQMTLNFGYYDPNKSLKVELSASVLGYLDYKLYDNGVATQSYTDINTAEYLLNATYGFRERKGTFSGHPLVLLGAGVKRVYDSAVDVTIPLVQFGVGYIIMPDPIEFYAQYYYNYLLETPTLQSQMSTIEVTPFNGVLEVGFNYHF